MNFRAFVRRGSEIYRRWRHEARIGGLISGVRFHWDGFDYIADEDPLSSDAVATIKDHHMVQLVLATAPVGEVVAVQDEQPAEPIEPVRPKVTLTLPQRPPSSLKGR